MANWVYDDPVWWANAVHQSCAMHAELQIGKVPTGVDSKRGFDLEAVSGFYDRTLQLLRSSQFEPAEAANLLFRAKALKKWKFADPTTAQARREAAMQGFIDRNYAAAGMTKIPKYLIPEMYRLLSYWLPEPERLGWSWTGTFGPGAVAEKWSRIKRLEHLLEWTRCGGHWPDTPPKHGDAEHVTARLHAVPKDFAKDRLITIEPAYGSFAQAYLREALQCSIHAGPLKGTAMDLQYCDSQAVQRRLALAASRNKRHATIDLKDASDRISIEDILSVFPSWVCALIDVSRSCRFSIDEPFGPYTKGQSWIMNIYAGMGNGSTFTIETLFFTAFVVAYAEYYGLPTFCSTFGDDVICDSSVARRLIEEHFPCFFVNKDKSFVGDDALRESCGIFAYKGVDITCPKVDGYPNSIRGRLGLSDLHRRLRNLPWAYAWCLSALIADTGLLVNWPFTVEGYPNIVDERFAYSLYPPMRYNRNTQHLEAKVPVAKPVQPRYPTDWKAAKAYNQPDPAALLLGYHLGMLGSREWTIGKRSARRSWAISVPERDPKIRFRQEWARVEYPAS